ncbi:MAG: hypothetical protein ACI84C_000115 [Flavobacteriales bacterium]|jgi:hypothetical protein
MGPRSKPELEMSTIFLVLFGKDITKKLGRKYVFHEGIRMYRSMIETSNVFFQSN